MIDNTRGRAAEIAAIVAELRPWLREVARQLYRDTGPLDGSDLVQETPLDACRCPARVLDGGPAEQRAWLKKVLVYRVADALRAQSRAKRDRAHEQSLEAAGLDERAADERPSPLSQAGRAEQASAVVSALEGLTPAQREAIRLRYWEKKKLREIAALLGCSTASAAALLERGMARLRDRLRPS